MTFYLKYRPKNLEEIDLKDVAQTLKKIVDSDNIPHAFLFSGPKGAGKTSAARILAKIINCQEKLKPCSKCDQCIATANGNNLDVIEMDAASNRGIDDVRALKDSIKLSPTLAKKKIYIIDEAHMLTSEASNALLKTLEEPPEHVVFILATTNPEKLIDTVLSRTTIVNFRKATNEEIVSSLKRVVEGEKLKISEEVLENIAKKSNGAFRDATKMLEQVSLEGEGFLALSELGVEEFVKSLVKRDRKASLSEIQKLTDRGISIEGFIKRLLALIQKEIVLGQDDLIDLAELLMIAVDQMKVSPIEELPIQIVVVKWCPAERDPALQDPTDEKLDIREQTTTVNLAQNVASVSINVNAFDNEEVWKKVLLSIKPINATLEALLRTSKPLNYDGVTLTLGVYYKFHKERLEDVVHRKVVEEVVTKVLNNKTHIKCSLIEAPISAPLTEDKDQDIIRVAEEIFSN